VVGAQWGDEGKGKIVDWLSLTETSQMVWLGLFALSLVLGIGLSWSHVRRYLSGQSDVDDIDE
ncbi:MAG: adenylosuccinate synthetase, partial [Pseudomonadota bacterium]